MRVHRVGVACLVLAVTVIVQCFAKDAQFFEDFGSGWDSRWVQSSDEKYNGKFEVESPKSLNDQALKVRPVALRLLLLRSSTLTGCVRIGS